MGLDQSAYTRSTKPTSPVDFEDLDDVVGLHYWRKHPNIQGWMEALYRQKGGTQKDFNCTPVELTVEDLDNLEQAIKNKTLPNTTGFFFGHSDGSEDTDDLEFIAKVLGHFYSQIRMATKNGLKGKDDCLDTISMLMYMNAWKPSEAAEEQADNPMMGHNGGPDWGSSDTGQGDEPSALSSYIV